MLKKWIDFQILEKFFEKILSKHLVFGVYHILDLTFVGWFKDAELVNEWNFEKDTKSDDKLVLYAKFK